MQSMGSDTDNINFPYIIVFQVYLYSDFFIPVVTVYVFLKTNIHHNPFSGFNDLQIVFFMSFDWPMAKSAKVPNDKLQNHNLTNR